MQALYFTKRLKNGKWRLYKIESQAIMAWGGSNDKTTVVRNDDGSIIQASNREALVALCKDKFGRTPLQENEVD